MQPLLLYFIKYFDERQVFNDTGRVFQPFTINMTLETKTGILKQIWSCLGLSTAILMHQNALKTSFFETHFKTNPETWVYKYEYSAS